MPSMQHEILVELFKNRPSLAAELLHEVFDETIPPYEEATVVSANLTEIQPAEYRADLVVTLLHEGVVVFVTVVEVQLAIDPDKRFTWPAYVAVTREEYRCPVDFLVIAPDPSVAKWCEEPIPMGVRRFVLEPPVLRRELVPKVTDSAEARRSPELALLSAMAYGDSTEVEEIGRAALEGFSSLDEKLAAFYTDLLYNAINEAARCALEAKMKGYVFTSPWVLEPLQTGIRIGRDEGVKLGRDEGVKLGRDEGVKLGRDEGVKLGRDEGLAEALLLLLRARNIDVPRATRERILGARDHTRLQRWLERAATAISLDDVFDEPN
jgi:hypothetical protein